MKIELIFGSIHLFCAGLLLSILLLTNHVKLSIFSYFVFGFNLLFGIYRTYKVYIGLSL